MGIKEDFALLGLFTSHRSDTSEALDRLRAIVEELPTTADGVPVVPGMRLWVVYNGEVTEAFAWGFFQHSTGGGPFRWCLLSSRFFGAFIYIDEMCYADRKAADAAKGKP